MVKKCTIYICRPGEELKKVESVPDENVTFTEKELFGDATGTDKERTSFGPYQVTFYVSPEDSAKLMKVFGLKGRRRRNRKRSVPINVPFYRHLEKEAFHILKKVGREQTRFNKNVRPKGTHSHFRLYR